VDQPLGAEKFIELFMGILYEALPFIILGAIISGLLEELVPQGAITRFLPKNRLLVIAIGGLLGLIFPMCECGIIPVMRRLLRKGVPLSCCICYMLAGPIINVVVLLSTVVAFSGVEKYTGIEGSGRQIGSFTMAGLRAVLAYIVAFSVALIVERQWRIYGTDLMKPMVIPDSKSEKKELVVLRPRPPLLQRISNIAETALHDFVDITVFLIIGALLAVTVRIFIPLRTLGEYTNRFPTLAIGLFMGLAIVLCLCSEADAFVAASFVSVPPAAKLAFLVLGPMLDFKLYLMFMRVFRPRLMWTIIFSVVILVFVLANITHLVLQNMPDSWYQTLTEMENGIRSAYQAVIGAGSS
jgi:uncharacterized membrane protein YraQ (UPF0718 family)